jgi:hypothetical protein
MFVDEDFVPPVMDYMNVPSEIEMARRRETGQVGMIWVDAFLRLFV